MSQQQLKALVEQIEPLRACIIVTMPDCLLCSSYQRDGEAWDPELVAAYFGDLMRSNRQNLEQLDKWTDQTQVTIESANRHIVVKQLNAQFVVGFAFEGGVPLGMVRLHISRMMGGIESILEGAKPKELSRGKKLINYLERYAPDTHAAMLRLSLQTGLPMALLQQPDEFSEAESAAVEESVQRILGLERLSL